jgi:hypothetical protein
MTLGDLTGPAAKEEGDPLKAVIDWDLKECTGSATAYAREKSEEPFWPIGLCVAWALRPDVSEAIVLYARHRVGLGVRKVDGWREAQAMLLRALVDARIKASGLRPNEGKRVFVPALEWIDLSIVQRGQFDEVKRPDGSIAYRDVRIEAAELRREWQPETAAARTLREQMAREKDCLNALIERMRENPNDPVPKWVLVTQFPGLSERTFGRLYSQAARDGGSGAWVKGGRRPGKKGMT